MSNPDLKLAAQLDLNTLRATVSFASTEETRYYLNGVCVEIEEFAVTYVATDGHRLFARRLFQSDRNTLLGTFIIPRNICEAVKPAKRRKGESVVRQNAAVMCDDLRPHRLNTFTLHYDDTMLNFRMIDGTFPDWRRVLPADEDYADVKLHGTGALNCNWLYMADFAKAAKALDAGAVSLFPAKADGPMRVQFSDDKSIIAVVMPIRGETKLTAKYAWQERTYSPDYVSEEAKAAGKLQKA